MSYHSAVQAASRFQKSVALSSGVHVTGVAEGLNLQRLSAEFGMHFDLRSLCVSRAARGS